MAYTCVSQGPFSCSTPSSYYGHLLMHSLHCPHEKRAPQCFLCLLQAGSNNTMSHWSVLVIFDPRVVSEITCFMRAPSVGFVYVVKVTFFSFFFFFGT